MRLTFTGSRTSINLRGKPIPGALDRHERIPGFDQAKFSRGHVLCIGAGGIMAQIAPTIVRKGIGRITILDADIVEPSNLNRQRFYKKDIGKNKAIAFARNLFPEATAATDITGYAMTIEQAAGTGIDLAADVVVCGVDNNPARVFSSRYFGERGIPMVFTAVSRDGDHGYVFVQEEHGPCIACLFPDIVNDDRYPCPGTPAIVDILQMVGSLSVYAIDTILTNRVRVWNYRRVSLADSSGDGGSVMPEREGCGLCG